MQRNFMDLLRAQWGRKKFLSVGLDVDLYHKNATAILREARVTGDNSIIASAMLDFSRMIVEKTVNSACCFKPNFAFWIRYGQAGLSALQQIIAYIQERYPEIPIILDAKFGDIGNTNLGYVDLAFYYLQADAVTVHSYLGPEAMKPFLDLQEKGVIILVHTSNKGADKIQDVALLVDEKPLFLKIASDIPTRWNYNKNCLVVAGATYPNQLKLIRSAVGDDIPILIPGIGTQGGDLKLSVKYGLNSQGTGIIINSSSGIIHASGSDDFAEAAGHEAQRLYKEINRFREEALPK